MASRPTIDMQVSNECLATERKKTNHVAPHIQQFCWGEDKPSLSPNFSVGSALHQIATEDGFSWSLLLLVFEVLVF